MSGDALSQDPAEPRRWIDTTKAHPVRVDDVFPGGKDVAVGGKDAAVGGKDRGSGLSASRPVSVSASGSRKPVCRWHVVP